MEIKKYDLIVLGAGPGGYSAAIRAAQLGKKVALIEKNELGGICLNEGCIPTKTFLEYVDNLNIFKKAGTWGVDLEIKNVNFRAFLKRKEKIVSILVNGLNKTISSYGIDVYRGEGVFIKPGSIEVRDREDNHYHLEAPKIIIASGSFPRKFSPFDLPDEGLIDSSAALKLEIIPQSLVIVGGGVIGCEFASIFSGLGTKVILVEIEKNILPEEDREISRRLEFAFRASNIKVYKETKVEKIERRNDSLYLKLSGGAEISGEKILIALGRTPNTKIKGIEKLGSKDWRNGIKVNEHFETDVKGIYAVGDVTGGPFLAHRAYQEGVMAAENAFGGNNFIDREAIPYCVYTLPEIARAGLTEEEAAGRGIKIKVGRYPFGGLSRAVISNEQEGIFKIISREDNDKILGIHIMGKRATDLIGEGVLALKLGLTVKDLIKIIHAHPTFYEGIRSAAEDVLDEAIHLPLKILKKNNRPLN